MNRRLRIYIAGPYSKPDPCANTRAAMLLWRQLWDLGHAPFCPHWSHFQHTFDPMGYEEWLAFDLEYLSACDILLRMPGESSGADREVAFANERGIPVVHSIDHLRDHLEGKPWTR